MGGRRGALHPLAAMAEPLLLQFTGGREQVQEVYDRYATARDPWLRAMGTVLPRDARQRDGAA